MKRLILLMLSLVFLLTFSFTALADNTDTSDKPKYIFLLIGDGFGVSHAALGSIYSRIANEDMDMGANWETSSHSFIVNACNESASGGTALATGYLANRADRISITSDDEFNDLYTIMDRAHDNDFATGVITNSFIYDATPATFLSHTSYRGNCGEIMKEITTSNVDLSWAVVYGKWCHMKGWKKSISKMPAVTQSTISHVCPLSVHWRHLVILHI